MRIGVVFLLVCFLLPTTKVFAIEETKIWRLQLAIASCNWPQQTVNSRLSVRLTPTGRAQILNNPGPQKNTRRFDVYELIPAHLFLGTTDVALNDIKELSIISNQQDGLCIERVALLLNNPYDLWQEPEQAFQNVTDTYRVLDVSIIETGKNQNKTSNTLEKRSKNHIKIEKLHNLWNQETAVSVNALPIIIPENYWEGVVRSSFGHQLALLEDLAAGAGATPTWSNQRDAVKTIYTNRHTRVEIQLYLSSTDPRRPSSPQKPHPVHFDLIVDCSGAELDIKIENIRTNYSPAFHLLTFGYAQLLESSLQHAAGASILRRNLAFSTSCIAPNFLQAAKLLSLL